MVNTHSNNASNTFELESMNSASPATAATATTAAADDNVPNFPYRRGLSCLLRGLLGTFSAAVLALTVAFMTMDALGSNIARTTFAAPIAAAGLGAVINYPALISSILRRYGPKGHWKLMIILDPIVFALGIWAFTVFAYNVEVIVDPPTKDFKGVVKEDSKPLLRDCVAYFSLLIALFHLLAALGGVWGFVIVNMRKKNPGRRGPWITRWAHPASSGKVSHTGYPEPK